MQLINKYILNSILCLLILSGCATKPKSISPDSNTQMFIDRGVAFMEFQEWDLAEASFRIAIENQQVPQAYDGLGCVLLAKGQISNARHIFEDIIDWFPDYVDVFWHLAYLEELDGNLLLASDWHKKAVQANALGYKEKNNYALFLQDRYIQDKTDNFSKDLAISYLEDVTAIAGNKKNQKISTINNKLVTIKGSK